MTSPLAQPVYWFRQGIEALTAFARPVDFDLAAAHLSPELLLLFRRMQRNDQLHSLNVLRSVLAQVATTPPDLATAALLHDAGKSRYHVMVWQRTLATLLWVAVPARFERLGRYDGSANNVPYWRQGFVIYTQHPAWSAEMAAPLGASESALWLMAHHQEDAALHSSHPLHPLLQRLQTADDAN
ncbi:MAG: hypothetical protein H7175_07530 [Burkholderiales bacterium]|nr:hypothetical protein [Anaerolineae bacterium]